MPSIGINRLRLRGPPHQRGALDLPDRGCMPDRAARQREAGAIRRLELGRDVTAREPAERTAAVRRAYEQATRDSRHGGERCRGKCELRLVRQPWPRRACCCCACFLTGRRPSGWYWPLAVSGWRGQSLAEWLGESAPGHDALGALGAPGRADRRRGRGRRGRHRHRGAGQERRPILASRRWTPRRPLSSMQTPTTGSSRTRLLDRPPAIADLIGTLHGLRARMPIVLAGTIEAIVRRIGTRNRAAGVLLERLLVRASPALALSPILLRQLAALYARSGWPRHLSVPTTAG